MTDPARTPVSDIVPVIYDPSKGRGERWSPVLPFYSVEGARNLGKWLTGAARYAEIYEALEHDAKGYSSTAEHRDVLAVNFSWVDCTSIVSAAVNETELVIATKGWSCKQEDLADECERRYLARYSTTSAVRFANSTGA